MPAKFEEDSLFWVAADQPLKDNSFLSAKILDLCKDVPIFWLRPTYPNSRASSYCSLCLCVLLLVHFVSSLG